MHGRGFIKKIPDAVTSGRRRRGVGVAVTRAVDAEDVAELLVAPRRPLVF